MKNLFDLIRSFNEEEAELVVKHYLLKRNSYSKRLKLFNMVRLEGISDDRTAAKRLYNRSPNAAFSQLKKRLKEDILNLLLVFNLQPDNYCGYSEAEMQASKLIMQGKLLIKRGLSESGITLLKKAFKLAGEFEAFEVQTFAYETLKNYADNHNSNDFHELELQFSKNVDILYDLINLRLDHVNDGTLQGVSSTIPTGVAPITKNSTELLCNDSPKSSRLKFQYTMKLTEEFFQQRMYQKARETAEEILPILDHENQVLRPGQKGLYYLQFSEILLCLGFYPETIYYAQKSQSYFNAIHEGIGKTYELQFKGYFYNADLANAETVMNQFFKLRSCHDIQTQNKFELFNAWFAFKNADCKSSIKTLNNCFKLSKNNHELTLNGKLLELLNLLKMQDFDWFDYKLESFRKYLNNIPPKTQISRSKLIYKLFNSLKQSRYQWSDCQGASVNAIMNMLADKNKPYSWNPLGYELIQTNQWMSVYK